MRMRSVAIGEWPTGVHWSPGEEREITPAPGEAPPGWLLPAAAPSLPSTAAEPAGPTGRPAKRATRWEG